MSQNLAELLSLIVQLGQRSLNSIFATDLAFSLNSVFSNQLLASLKLYQ